MVKKGKKKGEDEKVVDDGRPKMTILFGSQTGTAEDFSGVLKEEAKKRGFNAKVVDMEEYNPLSLKEEELVLFVVATYGEGEPTDNAKDFFQWMNNPSSLTTPPPLSSLKYGVFGLGNRCEPLLLFFSLCPLSPSFLLFPLHLQVLFPF